MNPDVSSQRALISTTSMLKQKASQHSVTGVLIACGTIIIATILSGYFTTGEIGLEAFVYAQKNNVVLWFLDAMPFVFALWGQHVSTRLSQEAGSIVIDQTSELRKHSINLEKKAAYDATHDSLTALPNRTLFIDRLQQATNSARRDNFKLGILLLDIDRFKEVNDTLGHHNGDRLLKQVAMRLSSVLRESDTFARLGGDEFGVILPFLKEKTGVSTTAKKIEQALANPFILENLSIVVHVSIGASTYPEDGPDADTLIQKADVAMYAAKQDNLRFSFYSKELDQHNPKRLTLVGELRQGIDNGQLLLYYQPKLDSQSDSLKAVEALVRWDHPNHGIMSPDDFIPLAERTGLINDLTTWVLKEALQQCAKWHEQKADLEIAVNVSSICLLNPEFPEILTGLLSAYHMPANRLVLEITETSMMNDPDRALAILNRIHQQGVKISIDDFGTGYSSLAYLKKLPVSELKIDKSFVMDMLKDESDATIVKATIQLGHNLGLQVVAEGVETAEIYERLRDLDCDLLQGYHISRPIAAKNFTAWSLANNHFKTLPR